MAGPTSREGSLEAPKRLPIEWQTDAYYDKEELYTELERVYDICHGCRRCVSLCESFPTLFDLVDESDTFEVDGVDKNDYMKVVDQCFLCDLCAETKCPYLPPHEWAVDFPHLMLRAKAHKFKESGAKWRDRLITSTDPVFSTLSVPGIAQTANAAAGNDTLRKLGDSVVGMHAKAPLPKFHSKTLSKRVPQHLSGNASACDRTTGKVAIYVTCYGNHNEPEAVEDMIAVLQHNGIAVRILSDAKCCGMPKLELGDMKQVAKQKDANLPVFMDAIRDGYDIIAPIPSCVLMYKQELPLMFPDDEDVATVQKSFFDPFEYLSIRRKAGLISEDFKQGLGKVAYHAACHQRVQSFGQKTREFLASIPDTDVTIIERCSGHDGTYAVKSETYDNAMKIARPVVRRVKEVEPDHFGSDCPMAGRLIEHGMEDGTASHPLTMLRKAYGV
ncbi:MAG: heterodisulfide reductase-related iron-sulfur binding cluster [Pseudomonadaceae bacterium]|nr:heterodisulfide reductase-related iron-sulfur binding cluster [Pseudomonadaceae bacterium]